MFFIIDFTHWTEDYVKQECEKQGLSFGAGFAFAATCTKLASHMIKRRICTVYSITPEEWQTTGKGKPYFENSAVKFNISHHGSFCVAIATDSSTETDVGIDITDKETIFTEDEEIELYGTIPPDGIHGLFWAGREAYLKYLGVGNREEAVRMLPPSHAFFPDIRKYKQIPVFPVMKIENKYARVFTLGPYIGVVIAPYNDIVKIQIIT